MFTIKAYKKVVEETTNTKTAVESRYTYAADDYYIVNYPADKSAVLTYLDSNTKTYVNLNLSNERGYQRIIVENAGGKTTDLFSVNKEGRIKGV